MPPGQVERTGVRSRLGHVAEPEEERERGDGDVDEEDCLPGEPLEQQAAGERAEPDARAAVADQIAIAFARSSRGKMFEMIESVAGMISAAPTPITARTLISWPAEPTNNTHKLARPKIAVPAWRPSFRPNRSLKAPNVSTRPAKTSR